MKIICPFCKQGCERDEIVSHLWSFHDSPQLSSGLGYLLAQIYEKIEVGLEYRDSPIDKEERKCADDKLKMLYSLLQK